MFFKKDPMSAVEGALNARGLKYMRVDSNHVLTGFNSPAGMLLTTIDHEADKETLLFLMNPLKDSVHAFESLVAGSTPFLRVHPSAGHSAEQVARVCEHLLHRNYRMALGAFERDPADGEIRMRIALPYRNTTPTAEQVNWCLDIGVSGLAVVVMEINELLGSRKAMEI